MEDEYCISQGTMTQLPNLKEMRRERVFLVTAS